MARAHRSDVVSSFTIIKGALADESYEIFREWDFSRSKKENLDQVREFNLIGAKSRNWLRDVCKVINRRFDPNDRDKPLVLLAKAGMERELWVPLLLWHVTRDEFLLRDFLTNWLYPEFRDGTFRIRIEDLFPYLESIEARGLTSGEHSWSDTTRKRVATGLLGIAGDVGLVTGSVTREFAGLHLRQETLLYLLLAIREQEGSASRVLTAVDWRMYLMSSEDLERELLRLHQFHRLEFHRAGSLVELTFPFESPMAYVESLMP